MLSAAPDGRCGSLWSRQLLRDKEVTFAGYKFPHPLDYHILIKVQTKGKKSPREVMDDALTDLCDEFDDIRAKFQAGLIPCQFTRICQGLIALVI